MSLKKLTVIFIVVTVAYCLCNKKEAMFQLDPTLADQMCSQHKVEFQVTARSVLHCAQLCTAHSRCITIIFHHGNNTCFGLNEYSPFSENISMPGAKFYRPRLNESFPMIAPLSDAQFSASSIYNTSYAAHRARLCDTYCWAPTTWSSTPKFPIPPQEYLQVDFLEPRVVTSIIIRGYAAYNEWVTTYKLAISNDCTTFVVITDISSGYEKIFNGPVDATSDVENAIEPPVVTRCFRIHPVTWTNYRSIRIEAMGYFA